MILAYYKISYINKYKEFKLLSSLIDLKTFYYYCYNYYY